MRIQPDPNNCDLDLSRNGELAPQMCDVNIGQTINPLTNAARLQTLLHGVTRDCPADCCPKKLTLTMRHAAPLGVSSFCCGFG
jgi:hypothetical protein